MQGYAEVRPGGKMAMCHHRTISSRRSSGRFAL